MKTPAQVRSVLMMAIYLLFLSFLNHADTDDPRVNKIVNQFNLFRASCKQQKIYLHTDKDIYMAGETIWIKAYLMDASNFMPDTISKDIYIEFVGANNTSVRTIILRNKTGFSHGDIAISDTLIEGNYQIRAYTNWMRNFESDFFFHKSIAVKNPNYENIITNDRLKEIKRYNKRLRRTEKKINVQFFPEGGSLIAGLPGRVAFKAESGLMAGLNFKGALFNNQGKEIVTFQSIHDGMGSFEFTPEPGLKYTAKITFEDGETDKFALPAALNKGVTMSVDPLNQENIKITIRSNRPVSENIASNEVIIVGQSNGVIHFISKGEIKDKPVISLVPKKKLPAGITQFTLFDGRSEPLCERLVFIAPKTGADAIHVNFSNKSMADSIIYQINLTQPDGSLVKGNFSLAMRENDPGSNHEETENIMTNLLLTSDLKGHINNPAYYFNELIPEAPVHLDLVMLTHGWRRFVWKDIVTNKFPMMKYPYPGGIAISGKITRDFFEIPVPNSKVMLSILNTYNDKFETLTDGKGQFEFPLMNYDDTIDVKIEAFKPSGGKGVQIILGDTLTPNLSTKMIHSFQNETYPKEKLKANNRRERLEAKKRLPEKNNDNNTLSKIHETPNDVMQVGQDANNYSNILQYMQGKIPGVNISGNRVIIRGINTFYGSTDPLFLMDGVPIDPSSVSSINPSDIATIEVLKGPEAAIYGSRGANGVIAFYSKRGQFMKRGVIEFGMQGYYKAREFYVPSSGQVGSRPQDIHIPRTIYWKPFVITNSEGTATIRFKKPPLAGKLDITLEGTTNTGQIIYYKKQE